MHSPPEGLADRDVLTAARRNWSPAVDRVEHLPVGFGAWHWRAEIDSRPQLFITVDPLGGHHDLATLDATYAATSAVAASLDAVVAVLPTSDGRHAVPIGEHAISATPWIEGERAGEGPPASSTDAEATVRMLHDLHSIVPPSRLRRWQPLVPVGFATDLGQRLGRPWDGGPHGERAAGMLSAKADHIAEWTRRYHDLAVAALASAPTWVTTHGEPHSRNQLRTPDGRLWLVDWESMSIAPRERDHRTLVRSGYGDLLDSDPEMLELFDLEWRLDEISQYAMWFSRPHADGADERVALDALESELNR